jgi:hypothetical protein
MAKKKVQSASETKQRTLLKEVVGNSQNIGLSISVSQGTDAFINGKEFLPVFLASFVATKQSLESSTCPGTLSHHESSSLLIAPKINDGRYMLLQILQAHLRIAFQDSMQPEHEPGFGD